MTKKLTFLLLLFAQLGFGQKDLLEQTISKIDWKQDSVQSVYNWVSQNVQYDVAKLNQIERPGKMKISSRVRNEEEYRADLLNRVLRNKKGVCEDYAVLFQAIIERLGYKGYIVLGYTKGADGKVNRSIGHAWNVVYSGEEWKFYDTTWGAGTVDKGTRFKKQFTEAWSNVVPSEMIKTHMPFDPIWQLLDAPITYAGFENGTNDKMESSDYEFSRLALIHYQLGRKQQMQEEVARSLQLGEGTRLISKWQRTSQKNIAMYGIISQPDLIQKTAELANETVELFNKYIDARNKQFKLRKWTKEYAMSNLLKTQGQLQSVIDILESIEVEDKKMNRFLSTSLSQSGTMLDHVEKEIEFVKGHTF